MSRYSSVKSMLREYTRPTKQVKIVVSADMGYAKKVTMEARTTTQVKVPVTTTITVIRETM
jgi:hypothetical protein